MTDICLDPAAVAAIEASHPYSWTLISRCIWDLLDAATRAMLEPHVRDNTPAGVSLWLHRDMDRQIIPAIRTAARLYQEQHP